MPDSVDKISGFTGLPRQTLLELWEQAKANVALLDACARHDFPEPEVGKPGARLQCRACGGLASAPEVRWYQLGLKHGGG